MITLGRVYFRESELFVVIRDGVSSLFIHGKARAETRTRGPRDLTVRSPRGSSSPVHGDDNDGQGGPRRATSSYRSSKSPRARYTFASIVESSPLLFQSSSSRIDTTSTTMSSGILKKSPNSDRRILWSTNVVSRSIFPISYRSKGSSCFYHVPGSKNFQRIQIQGPHTVVEEFVERSTIAVEHETNGQTVERMQRTRQEPTVRRLGLSLTDSVVALPASSGRDVFRSIEREREACRGRKSDRDE